MIELVTYLQEESGKGSLDEQGPVKRIHSQKEVWGRNQMCQQQAWLEQPRQPVQQRQV